MRDGQYLKDVFIDNIVLNAAAIRSKEHGEVLSQLNFQKAIVYCFPIKMTGFCMVLTY